MLFETIRHSYRTAWKWPRIRNETPAVVYLSRALFVLLPVFCVTTTFFAALATSLYAAIIIPTLIALGFIAATVLIFSDDYEEMVDYEQMEAHVRQNFHFTEGIMLREDPAGAFFAMGHIDKNRFARIVSKADGKDLFVNPNLVEHIYIHFDERDPEKFQPCEKIIRNSFPATRYIPPIME